MNYKNNVVRISRFAVVMLLTVTCFGTLAGSILFGANMMTSTNAAAPTQALPVSKGGTAVKTFESGKVISTDASAKPVIGKAIDTTTTSGSVNLLTSGAAYNIIPRKETLDKASILTMSNYFNMPASNILVRKFGDFMFIEGTFVVKTAIPVSSGTTSYNMFTIASGYQPKNYISVNCSTNFMNTGLLARLDCAYASGAVRIQTNVAIPVGKSISLNFVYIIG
ncbi:MAG: hypothetical protein LBB10_02670 [Bifidobacteriaceae bacterium]|jgi:hypothetical protein|nr:hypothetical protein [Bifidobacteriaceae bacterium]